MIGPRLPEPGERLRQLVAWAGAAEPAPGALFVLRLDPGGPAALSGQVREGDELVAVDRKRVAEMAPTAVAALLQGPLGSLVKLRIRRKTATFDVCLERDATRAVRARARARAELAQKIHVCCPSARHTGLHAAPWRLLG
jgi:C-terminal processing protease CtpA/Prc